MDPNFIEAYKGTDDEQEIEKQEQREADRIYETRVKPRLETAHYSYNQWENIVTAALSRFPELQQGEFIHLSEIYRQFASIKRAGYPLKPYSKLRKEDAWKYLMSLRTEIRRNVESCHPSILEKIDAKNREQQLEARL